MLKRMDKQKTILFLCTGNFFRSRFAEYYFNYFAKDLPWIAISRGLMLDQRNVGPISSYTIRELEKLGIPVGTPRDPIAVTNIDFEKADKIITLSAQEHQPIIIAHFPLWKEKVEYWDIGDLNVMSLNDAFPMMEKHLQELIASLR